MIVMRIKGGLGNQLFQYSAAYALSKRLNQPFQFNPTFTGNMTPRGYKFPNLNVDDDTVISDDDLPDKVCWLKNKYINKAVRLMNRRIHRCGDYTYMLETRDELVPEFSILDAPNVYIDGYFQSEVYFGEYREELLRQFTPRYEPELSYSEALEQIRHCNAVAVHVRRSDFKKDNNPFHYLLTEDYYRTAVRYMRERLKAPVFFWFSDDMGWVKQNIGDSKDFVFVTLKTAHGDIDDMMLMKNCNHIITANSTFSWWAAWLNEHEDCIRVVPKKPYGMDGMIPDHWVKISVE